MEELRDKKGFVCDMDGVLYHGQRLLPGAGEFVDWLKREDKRYLFLTNSPERTPQQLRERLADMGVDIATEHFYTSAQATAAFMADQLPGSTAYVIGEEALKEALRRAGLSLDDSDPDWVVVGQTESYNFHGIQRAVRLVNAGARLVATNPDITGPGMEGLVPATGSLVAPVEMSTGREAYSVGKPNPLMMRNGLKKLGCRREETAIIGDRMDTDIVAGVESEIETVLVLSGVTSRDDLQEFTYRPGYVLERVGDLVP